jgi:hypothetical protein
MKYNKWKALSMFVFMSLMVSAIAFADTTVVATTPAVKTVWQQLFEALSNIILTAIIPLMALGATSLGKWFQALQTSDKAQKYATIFNLATVGVKMAEAQYGPNTGKGVEKEKEAVQFLMTHVPGLQQAAAQDFVQAAYTDIFTILTPSPTVPAAKVSTT